MGPSTAPDTAPKPDGLHRFATTTAPTTVRSPDPRSHLAVQQVMNMCQQAGQRQDVLFIMAKNSLHVGGVPSGKILLIVNYSPLKW
jgi:hypothetical protein